MSPELVAFLNARLDEDAEQARLAETAHPTPWTQHGDDYWLITDANKDVVVYDEGVPAKPAAIHIARHDPTRVLAEVAAKRRAVNLHEPPCDECQSGEWMNIDGVDVQKHHGTHPCFTLRLLALGYADHPTMTRPGTGHEAGRTCSGLRGVRRRHHPRTSNRGR